LTSGEFELFLTGAMALCALMAIVVLFRVRSRGAAALVMSLAFLALGGVLYLLRIAAPQSWIIALSVLVAVLLLVDFLLRAGQQADKDANR
jgi:hypothetical protein